MQKFSFHMITPTNPRVFWELERVWEDIFDEKWMMIIIFLLKAPTSEPKAHRWQSFFSLASLCICSEVYFTVSGTRWWRKRNFFPGPVANVDWDFVSTGARKRQPLVPGEMGKGKSWRKVVKRKSEESSNCRVKSAFVYQATKISEAVLSWKLNR